MTWFKVDDHLHAHPKAVGAGNAALGLWVRAGSWSAQQLTSGFIPAALARQYGRPGDVRALISAGLWHEVEGGYRFHDWADFQPTDEEVADLKRKRSEAGKAGAAKRWGRGKSHSNGIANAMPSEMANQYPDPGPVVSGLGSQSGVGRSGSREQATDQPDLDKIAAELGHDRRWAQRVSDDVLGRASRTPGDPTAYVLAAIRSEPQRYQPTSGPPPLARLCDHGRDRLTCPDCQHQP